MSYWQAISDISPNTTNERKKIYFKVFITNINNNKHKYIKLMCKVFLIWVFHVKFVNYFKINCSIPKRFSKTSSFISKCSLSVFRFFISHATKCHFTQTCQSEKRNTYLPV